MHKSRLGGLIIDCRTKDLGKAAEFWGQALGMAWEQAQADDSADYRTLQAPPGEPYMEVQRVDHASRVHLDIETDDVPAEVKRLEALGARRLGAVRDWVVMEAPTGQRFCVVPVVRGGFDEGANVWK